MGEEEDKDSCHPVNQEKIILKEERLTMSNIAKQVSNRGSPIPREGHSHGRNQLQSSCG